jgi:hypothetical protein
MTEIYSVCIKDLTAAENNPIFGCMANVCVPEQYIGNIRELCDKHEHLKFIGASVLEIHHDWSKIHEQISDMFDLPTLEQ